MPEDLDKEISQARSRVADANRLRVKAEHDRDAAQAASAEALAALHSEFGVDTPEAARGKLTELESQLAQELRAVTAALDEIGA